MKENQSRRWHLILITCIIIVIIFLFLFYLINPIYPSNFLKLLFYFWAIPTFLFFVVILIFLKLSSFDSDFKTLSIGLYYVLPIGFIYKLVEEFYYETQHNLINIVLDFGTVFVFFILYLVIGKILLALIDK